MDSHFKVQNVRKRIVLALEIFSFIIILTALILLVKSNFDFVSLFGENAVSQGVLVACTLFSVTISVIDTWRHFEALKKQEKEIAAQIKELEMSVCKTDKSANSVADLIATYLSEIEKSLNKPVTDMHHVAMRYEAAQISKDIKQGKIPLEIFADMYGAIDKELKQGLITTEEAEKRKSQLLVLLQYWGKQ